ncbi:MAG: CBS domain-containing protein [Flavobacteriales bacterium]
MLAVELISDHIPPLKTSDSGMMALAWMDEFKVNHLPIVNNREFLGLISDTDVLDLNEPEQALGNHQLSLFRPFVYDHQHLFDVLKLIVKLDLSLIPVLNKDNEFLGSISMKSLLTEFAKTAGADQTGGIIVLELNDNDYHLSQIAQIVESNNSKILSLYLQSHSDSTKLDVTIKVNRENISGILQTFARYNYVVKATFQQGEFSDDLRQRYDMFMNYINM